MRKMSDTYAAYFMDGIEDYDLNDLQLTDEDIQTGRSMLNTVANLENIIDQLIVSESDEAADAYVSGYITRAYTVAWQRLLYVILRANLNDLTLTSIMTTVTSVIQKAIQADSIANALEGIGEAETRELSDEILSALFKMCATLRRLDK